MPVTTFIKGTVVWRCKDNCFSMDADGDDVPLTEFEYALLRKISPSELRLMPFGDCESASS